MAKRKAVADDEETETLDKLQECEDRMEANRDAEILARIQKCDDRIASWTKTQNSTEQSEATAARRKIKNLRRSKRQLEVALAKRGKARKAPTGARGGALMTKVR